jgi:probable phosphoglycerate mutase
MELILVRHGLPQRSATSADPELAPEGHDQAARVAAWLADEPIHAVWSSPMRRAVQTAQPFATGGGHAIREHEGIVEFDRGSGAYIPTEVLKREDYAAWQAMAQGGHGVDMADFQATVVAAVEEIIAAHAGQRVAVFCHGGVINVWAAHVLETSPRVFFEADYTSLSRFLCARFGQRAVVSLNERAHLR